MNNLNYTALWGFLFGLSVLSAFGDVIARASFRGDDPPTKWSYIFRACVLIFGSLTALTWGG